MAVDVGSAVAYLTLDTSGYTEALNAASERMKEFSGGAGAMSEGFGLLGNSAKFAGAAVKEQMAAITDDYRAMSAEYRFITGADSLFFMAESAARENAHKAAIEMFAAAYLEDAENSFASEAAKTENFRNELRVQERDVFMSQEANLATLKEYVPKWYAVGQEFGNMLLKGVRSTRNEILGYLEEIADGVNAASSGSYDWGGYANGTDSAAEGLAVVGEAGPEIVDFSGGEKVLTFERSVGLLNETIGKIGEQAERMSAAEYALADGYGGGFGQSAARSFGVSAVDYRKLAEAVAAAVRPSVTYSPTYNSPMEMSVSEMRAADRVNAERLGFGY